MDTEHFWDDWPSGRGAAALSLRDEGRITAIASAHAGAALIGFGMAPGSPLAAAGAIALMLVGLLWVSQSFYKGSLQGCRFQRSLLVGRSAFGRSPRRRSASNTGWWLPFFSRRGRCSRSQRRETRRTLQARSYLLVPALLLVVLLLAGLYPQAPVEWIGAARSERDGWRRSRAQELADRLGCGVDHHISGPVNGGAALPATGIALVVALRWWRCVGLAFWWGALYRIN